MAIRHTIIAAILEHYPTVIFWNREVLCLPLFLHRDAGEGNDQKLWLAQFKMLKWDYALNAARAVAAT